MGGIPGIGGINALQAAVLAQPLQSIALRPGQVLQGIVQSIEPQTLLRFGNLVIPVERVEGIQPGQAISAEVVSNGNTLQLRLAPGTLGFSHSAGAEQAHLAARELPSFVVNALRALGKLELADQAVHLVSPHVARNASAVRLVLALLLDRNGGDGDAERVLAALQQAVDDGALSPEEAGPALRVLQNLAPDLDQVEGAVRQSAEGTPRPIAARLAEAIAHGSVKNLIESLGEDAAAILHRLRENEPLSEFLKQSGQHGDFARAVDRIIERFTAAQLVNARAIDMPYLFLDIPMPIDAPITHAQIHVLGDGGGKAHKFDAKNATVVFDLSTTALGELWITLNVSHGQCSCWIRAQNIDTVAALDANAATLATQLAEAGYQNASVHATLWDGDRVHELSAMMRRFGGLNLQA